MIKVLIVDDSAVTREYLRHMFNSTGELAVIGEACNGEEAVRLAERRKPDVITMDIRMPVMDGFEATRRIMSTNPTPIIICSVSYEPGEVGLSFQALEAGALTALAKPTGLGHPDSEALTRELISTVKAMAGVKVITRRFTTPPAPPGSTAPRKKRRPGARIVAIGASTGGPVALRRLFDALPADLPFPIVAVQHISPGFTHGLAEWLDGASPLQVRIAGHGDALRPGRVYLAPNGTHTTVGKDARLILTDLPPVAGVRPAVAHLFRSVADAFADSAVGILLTGMGRDGAAELKYMKDRGGVTVVQDRESSVVYGMPGEALALDAAMHVLSPEGIAGLLMRLANGARK